MGDFNSDVNSVRTDRYDIKGMADRSLFSPLAEDTHIGQPSYRHGDTGHKSRLDYILHTTTQLRCRWTRPVELDFQEGDHSPVAAVFEVRTAPPLPPILRQVLPADIKMSDEAGKERYTAKVLAATPALLQIGDDEEFLEAVAATSTGAVQRKDRGTKGKRRFRGSPKCRTLRLNVDALIVLKRHIEGTGRRSPWRPGNFQKRRTKWLDHWRRDRHHITGDEDVATGSTYDISFWTELTLEQTTAQVSTALRATTDLLSRVTRNERYALWQHYARERERLASMGKIGRAIAGILERHRTAYTMETLRTGTGIITDPDIIHAESTTYWNSWFADRFISQGGTVPIDEAWEADEESFLTRTADTGVPDKWRRACWRALRCPLTQPVRAAIESALNAPISFDDYMAAVRSCPYDSVGGRTGLTFNMIRLWPEVLQQRAYVALNSLWERRRIPSGWKEAWLVPIPKIPNPTLADLRPLMLIDALRKVWMKITVNRIQRAWAEHKVLQEAQDGSIRFHTIDTTNLGFVNALETGKETGSQCYFSSMDMRRAFDSARKRLLRWCWQRLGVPAWLARYIVDLDTDAHVVVRTPRALQDSSQNKPLQGFSPRRGTGQGDVASPLAWIAYFDVVLRMLEEARADDPEPFGLVDLQGRIGAVTDFAFVDDLVSFAGTADGLQRLADCFSAWSVLVGIDVAIPKLRAAAVNWGPADDPMTDHLTIHGAGWTPHRVPYQTGGGVKYVGVHHDLHMEHTTQYQAVVAQLRETVALAMSKRASAGLKWTVLRRSLMESVVYRTRACAWPLSAYHKLDRMVAPALRTLTKNMRSAPAALLHMASPLGLGLTRLSDHAQTYKWAMTQRLLHGTARDKIVIGGLIARTAREVGSPIIPGTRSTLRIGVPHHRPYWFTSVLEWFEELGVQIVVSGLPPTAQDTLLSTYVRGTTETLSTLTGSGVATRGELWMEGDRHSSLVDTAVAAGLAPCGVGPVTLRVGQVWSNAQNATTGSCWEIMGYNDHTVWVVEWTTRSTLLRLRVGERVTLERANGRNGVRGAGSTSAMSLTSILEMTKLVTLGKETQEKGTTAAEVVAIRPRLLRAPTTGSDHGDLNDLTDWMADGHAFYVDGRWGRSGTLEDRLRGTESSTGTGVLVKETKGGQRTGVRIRFADGTAPDLRWVGFATLAIGLHYGPAAATYYTRSTKAISIYERCQRQGWAHDRYDALKSGLQGLRRTLLWVDRKAAPPGATDAKALAKGKPRPTLQSWWSTDGTPLVDGLTSRAILTLRKGEHLVTADMIQLRSRATLSRYLRVRDDYRERLATPKPRAWEGRALHLGAAIIKECTEGLGSHAGILRLFWDKHYWGSKQREQTGTSGAECRWCGADESRDHIILRCRHHQPLTRRHEALKRADAYTAAARVSARGLLRAYERVVRHGGGTVEHWTGILEPADVRLLMGAMIEEECGDQLWRELRDYARIYFDAALDIVRAYLADESTQDKFSERPPRVAPTRAISTHGSHVITTFFKRVEAATTKNTGPEGRHMVTTQTTVDPEGSTALPPQGGTESVSPCGNQIGRTSVENEPSSDRLCSTSEALPTQFQCEATAPMTRNDAIAIRPRLRAQVDRERREEERARSEAATARLKALAAEEEEWDSSPTRQKDKEVVIPVERLPPDKIGKELFENDERVLGDPAKCPEKTAIFFRQLGNPHFQKSAGTSLGDGNFDLGN